MQYRCCTLRVPLEYHQGTAGVPPSSAALQARRFEECPRVPVEYPVEYRLSPAAGKAIEDFSQFIEEAEVRCTH